VQFPRCRATVSEKIAAVHWEHSREGRLQIPDFRAIGESPIPS
jgi:hypothetical protein